MPENHLRDKAPLDGAAAVLYATCLLIPLILNPWGYDIFPQVRRFALFIGTLVVVFLLLVRALNKKSVIVPRGLPAMLGCCLVAWLAVATATSVHLKTSFFGRFLRYEGLITWVCYLIIFLVAMKAARDKNNVRFLARCVSLVALVIGLTAILQFAGFHLIEWSREMDLSRPFSTLGNAGLLGGFLVLSIPVTVSLAICESESSAYRILAVASIALQMVSLVMTMTRSAWAGALVSLVVFIPVLLGWLKGAGVRKRKRVCTFALLMAATCVISVFALVPSYRNRLVSTFETGEGTAHGRILVWGLTLDLVGHHPFLGTGPDTFAQVAPEYWTAEMERELGRGTIEDNPHNYFLQVAAAGGIPALLLLLALLGSVLYTGVFAQKRQRRSRSGEGDQGVNGVQGGEVEYRDLPVINGGILAAVAGFVVYLFFSFSSIDLAPLFWLMCGTLVGASRGSDARKWILKGDDSAKASYASKAFLLVVGATAIAVAAIPLGRSVIADSRVRDGLKLAAAGDNLLAGSIFTRCFQLDRCQYHETIRGQNMLEIGRKEGNRDQLLEGLDLLERSVELNQEDGYSHLYYAEGLRDAGSLLGDMSILEQAEGQYCRVLERDYNFYRAHLGLGNVFASMGRIDSAVREWKKAVDLSSEPIEAYLNLARLYMENGRSDDAVRFYREVLRIDPINEEAGSMIHQEAPESGP